MPATYYVQWRSRTGVQKKILALAGPGQSTNGYDAVLRLAYRREVNGAGWFRIDVPGNAPFLPTVEDRDQVQIFRRLPGGDWRVDFEGIFRDEFVSDSEYGQETAQLSGPGVLGLLSSYHVMWYADTPDQTTFTDSAETILKRLVRFNATAEATTVNGRIRDLLAPPPITVQADGATGSALSINPGAWRNLLTTLQRVQEVSGLDFDLIRTGDNSWEFQTFVGARGADLRPTLTLSRELGTLRNIRYELRRSPERTVAVVGGNGEKNERITVIRTGPNYGPLNEVETFVDAADASNVFVLNTRGDVALRESLARPTLNVEVVPTESVRYGDQFDVGDLCRLFYSRIGTIDVQVVAVTVEVIPGQQSGERVSVEVRRIG